MSERMRTMFIQLREYVGNRRHAARHSVRLPVTIHVRAAPEMVGGANVPPLTAFTKDISASGLALVVSAIRTGTIYLTREGTSLRLTLELPDGARLTCDAAPVRYHQLESETPSEKLYLIGARITEIGDAERKRLDALLKSLSK